MLDPDLVAFVLGALPPAPANLLEVGAGSGELAEHLRSCGYQVLAIDPAATLPAVEPIALAQLEAPAEAFDAAVAVLSLHHVEPLAESCERLAHVMRPGGVLVIDEFDISAFDLREARWWLEQHPEHETSQSDPEALAGGLRAHLHPLERVLAALAPWFDFGETRRGPYLYRWKLGAEVREVEQECIATGLLAPTGARVVARRRSSC